jgi:hypothetical protein
VFVTISGIDLDLAHVIEMENEKRISLSEEGRFGAAASQGRERSNQLPLDTKPGVQASS